MQYSLFIGRYQVPGLHDGHRKLIETVLNDGKNALIAVRDVAVDTKNPFAAVDIVAKIKEQMSSWGDKVEVILIPDIEEVCYGRDVGWGIRKIELDAQTESISGTKIRAQSNS